MNPFSGNALWHMILQSDFVTKLVLLLLLFMSIVCWAIFFYKLIMLRLKKRQIDTVITQCKKAKSVGELEAIADASARTLPGYFLKSNVQVVHAAREIFAGSDNRRQETLEAVQHSLDQSLDEVVRNEELYIPVLASCATVAPLLGLFGTVWGLVHAFMDISQKQSADIATVAPGIAEALITTLAGLLVAMPALLMYHYVASYVKYIEAKMVGLADLFYWQVHKNI